MAHSNGNLRVYFRKMEQGERTSLSVLAQQVFEGARVLDLGIGSGALGAHLHAALGCVVDGVTYNAQEAEVARAHYRRIEVADLETCSLPTLFAGAQYDFIVCADVLEHLRRPELVLAACRGLLAEQGRLLISIPNASYAGLVAELLHGEFRYRDEGLLDNTHLRFFTRRSLTRFLSGNGWALDKIEALERELPSSEFKVEFDQLPPAVARYLVALPDAMTYQFICVAQPSEAAAAMSQPPHAMRGVAGRALFTAELFLGRDGHYSEERKLTSTGIIGSLRQTIVFDLPGPDKPFTSFKLDPADRPGYLHLYRMVLYASNGTAQWEWLATDEGIAQLRQARNQDMLLRSPEAGASHAIAVLYANDPWVELPVPAPAVAAASIDPGARLEIEVGWPMSADYLAAAEEIAALKTQLAASASARQQLPPPTPTPIGIDGLHAMASRLGPEAADWYAAHDALLSEYALAATERATWAGEAARLAAEATRVTAERDDLTRQLLDIHASRIFRFSRPLVHAKAKLGRWLRRAPDPAYKAIAHKPTTTETPRVAHGTDTVDVVIPVYRGLADTRRCIESVLASKCTTPTRVIVINDGSPEPELAAWLRDAAAREPRLTLLENPQNLGFVATVNRGMALSEASDVLLLNSDAEVANDWLDRLRAAAYSAERVASVTPFSNNATICSYPRFCEANPLPEGYDTAALDALFARTNPGGVLDIPTAVGFCMYIRRECIAEVGLFDVESFGKGYGEENDFCRRALAAGWRNLHALDVFVSHSGGGSFGDTKSARELAAMQTLRVMHPDYEPAVQAFVAADPARTFRQTVDMARLGVATAPRILSVVHNLGGGTLRHVMELTRLMRERTIMLTLTPGANGSVVLQWLDPKENFELAFHWPEEIDDLVVALRTIGVSHIHVHHLLGHGKEILELPTRLKVGYDFTAHDYYAVCPQVSMTDHNNGYCGELGPDQCANCLHLRRPPDNHNIDTWRAAYGGFAERARHLLAPSADAARRLSRYLPAADIRLVPHTDIVPAMALPEPQPQRLASHASLRVVVIGALSAIKGADVLEAVAGDAARRSAPLEFHLLGYTYRALQTQPHASLTVHGAYTERDLPRLLERLKPDVVWFTALWPETYSYTLSACLKAGLPIVAPDLGAFTERLIGRRWTWLKPWDTPPRGWFEFFEEIRRNHFLTGQEPAIPRSPTAIGADALIQNWSYEDDYLRGIPAVAAGIQPSHAFVLAHQPGRARLVEPVA